MLHGCSSPATPWCQKPVTQMEEGLETTRVRARQLKPTTHQGESERKQGKTHTQCKTRGVSPPAAQAWSWFSMSTAGIRLRNWHNASKRWSQRHGHCEGRKKSTSTYRGACQMLRPCEVYVAQASWQLCHHSRSRILWSLHEDLARLTDLSEPNLKSAKCRPSPPVEQLTLICDELHSEVESRSRS